MNLRSAHYQCGVIGCDEARMYAYGVPRKQAVQAIRVQGWTVYDGECRCPAHAAELLEIELRASLAGDTSA